MRGADPDLSDSEVYFGHDAGGGFITSGTMPHAGYDPRKRPCYDAAVKAKDVAFSEALH